MTTDDFDHVIGQLRDLYLVELRAHGEALCHDLDAVEAALSADVLKALLGRVHRLAGTGATFGAVELSQVAEDLEILLRRISAGEAEADRPRILELGRRLVALAIHIA